MQQMIDSLIHKNIQNVNKISVNFFLDSKKYI
jgi:hypothetical protein